MNTIVSLLHLLPDSTGQCNLASVSVVDADDVLKADTIFLTKVEDLASEPLPGPTMEELRGKREAAAMEKRAQAEKARAEAEAQRLADEERIDKEEQKLGRCSDERHSQLEQVLGRLQYVVDSVGGRLVEHKYLLSAPEQDEKKSRKGIVPGTLRWTSGLPGDYSVVAVSMSSLSLRGKSPDGYTLKENQLYARFALDQGARYAQALSLTANMREEYVLRSVGSGCVMIAIFRVYR